jgi:broad specificity phosphatase PhoE
VAELILVRHGQANSHATDEASYDQLSPLGQQQARWLGAHMAATNPHFDRVYAGTLTRQQDTARAMGYAVTHTDPRLDELRYFDLAHALEAQHGIPAPTDPTEFAAHLPEVIDHWTRDALAGVPERFGAFAARVTGLIDEICLAHGRILVVTSGGVIGMVIRHALHLENGGMAKVMLQTMNSSVHRFEHIHGALMLGSFNATPHLDTPDRAHARTFV